MTLTDTVDHFLPDWPRGNSITVAMLLGHRSGMGDYGNNFGAQLSALVLSDLSRHFSYDRVLGLVRQVPPVAQPGVGYHYSNANYIVLGAIIQKVAHRTLGQLITARILKPLGLTQTISGPDDLNAAASVVFHGLYDVTGTGTPVDIGTFPRTAVLTVDPAGAGMFSNLPNLLAFVHTLFATNRLIASEQRSGFVGTASTLQARDLLLSNIFIISGHGGASPGAQTIVAYDRAHGTTVAVWCNRLDPGTYELFPSEVAANELFLAAATPSASEG